MHNREFLVVAALDFGTTYSGYAYSFRNDPYKVISNTQWYSGGASANLVALKTPTSVLLDDNGEFESFGYEAEDKFAALVEENRHRGWRLFRRFKMILHNNKSISMNTTVEDIEGKPYPAMGIFSMAIKYLHRHFIDAIQLRTSDLLETDIEYILAVPAIWDSAAKQFMREAAINAGIDGNRLEIAFESEVAALWCTHQITNDGPIIDEQLTGSKYIVVDLGGGIADISVHQRLPDGSVRALHKASGGAWGGICVDQNFLHYLDKVLGNGVLAELHRDHLGDFFEVIRAFETKKRSIELFASDVCTMRLPGSLLDIARNRNSFSGSDKLRFDELRIDIADVRSWFESPIVSLVEHIKEILMHDRISDVQSVLMVGGFAECKYVQDKLREALVDMNLIVPDDAGLAVLKGAVMFGHNPYVTISRVMPCTYGIGLYDIYDETKHPAEKRVDLNGEWVVENCFKVFVRANEEIPVDHKVSHISTSAFSVSAIPIYRTLSENPEYTTDPGCELVCKLRIKNINDMPLKYQGQEVTFTFGATELIVKAKHILTGKEKGLRLDYFL